MKKYILFLILILIFFFSPSISEAQTGIKISPIRIEGLVEPGEVIKKNIKVTNIADNAETFYLYLRDFKAGDETGKALLIPPGSEEGSFLTSWIEVTSEGIYFEAREEKEIPIVISVPEEAGPGGYYGAIVFGTTPPKIRAQGEERGAAVSIGHQTGCLVLLQVAGDVLEDAQLREFSTDKTFYSSPFLVDFLIRIENLGNVHIKPYGSIDIVNMFGSKVDSIKVNDQGSNVLPKSIRKFSSSWEGNMGFGMYRTRLALTYGNPTSLGGQGLQTITSERTFWILPWQIIIPSFLGFICLLVLIIVFLRFYKSKAVKKVLREAGVGETRYVKKYYGSSPAMHLSLIFLLIFLVVLLIGSVIFFLFFA